MRRWKGAVASGFTAILIACGSEGGVVDPLGNGEFMLDGLEVTAAVTSVPGAGPPLAVLVTLRNTTSATIVRTYPAGCPVRIRLFRLDDDTALYDETAHECLGTTPVEISVAPGASKVLTSGTRSPWAIHGDSLAGATYRFAAVLRIVGENPIELDAGLYKLPFCVNQPVLSCS
jgi:hypothetical protein